jgi:predicted nucleotidyltransferase component of viral defense system
MLNIKEIQSYYPVSLQRFDRFIFREYLQYKILELIFESKYANKLAFLGGTCLRIVHNNTRFSEDLDFDNFELSSQDFLNISIEIKLGLEKMGYTVEMRNVDTGTFHCYIRFPNILFDQGLSNHKNEKILIQLDSESQGFRFEIEKVFLNKFDVFTEINTTPKDLLLAQKFYAILNRPINKGRDFFDIVFLLGQGQKPNYDYLEFKVGINSPEQLVKAILDHCNSLDMVEMANDVSPFLFDFRDEKKVLYFTDYIKQTRLF